MGVRDRAVRLATASCNARSAAGSTATSARERHNGYFSDQAVESIKKLRSLKAKLNAPPRFVHNTIRCDQSGGARRFQKRHSG